MKYINRFNENNEYFDNVSPYIRNGYHLTKIESNDVSSYKGNGKIVYLNDKLANNFIELGKGYDEVIKLYSQLMTCPEISTRYWDIKKGDNPPSGYNLYKLDRTNLEFIPYKKSGFHIPEYEQRDLYYGEPRKIDAVNGLIKSYKELRSLDAKKIDYVSQITLLRKEENEKRHSN